MNESNLEYMHNLRIISQHLELLANVLIEDENV